MSPGPDRRRAVAALDRLQAVAVGALVLLMGATLLWAAVSPDFALLRRRSDARWIAAPAPATTGAVAARRDALPATHFWRTLELPEGGPLHLRVEALRGFALEVNGRTVAARAWDEGSWREPSEVVVSEGVAPGPNRIEVRVRNHRGPGLLRLRAVAPGVAIESDERFEARAPGGARAPARVADDRRRASVAVTGPVVAPALREHGAALALLAGLALAASLALSGEHGAALRRRLPGLAVALVAAGWLAFFAGRVVALPPHTGFDGPDHLEYVRHVLETRSLPLAADGPQMYQPPLFYVLSAAALALGGSAPAVERLALHALPFLSGAALVAVSFGLARLLFPRDRGRQTAAVVAAGVLPLHLYMAAYIGNEVLYSALHAATLLLVAHRLAAPGAPWWASLTVGALLGLAILAKVSGILLVPLALGLLAVKHAVVDRLGPAAVAGRALAAAAVAAAICGPWLARNQAVYGTPLVGNWDIPGQPGAWWQSPGFHRPDFFLRFGDVLRRPFFASFDGFWDGLYATFFGDGLLGGVSAWQYRHPLWDYDWMAIGYLLALPAAALVVLGFAGLAARAWREPDPGRRGALWLLVSAAAVTVFATLVLNLEHPVYSMAHARYVLAVSPVLVLCGVEGFVRARRGLAGPRRRWARVALETWAGTLVLVFAASFAG